LGRSESAVFALSGGFIKTIFMLLLAMAFADFIADEVEYPTYTHFGCYLKAL
jgi:hypothetical protein